MYDLLIKNGIIVDGLGTPRYPGDIAISKGKIIKIATGIKEGRKIINVNRKIIAPGFIDIHSHADLAILKGEVLPKIEQGITTEIVGNCGFSAAPIHRGKEKEIKEYLKIILGELPVYSWHSFKEYFNYVRRGRLFQNIGSLVGHGNLRIAAMSFEKRKATRQEIAIMKELLKESLKNGGLGLSTGLIYPPGCYATYQELKELCQVAAEFDVPYVSHIRNESSAVVDSVKEAIKLGQETGVAVHISHHKVCGKNNWGESAKTIEIITKARSQGVRISLDQYPYLAGSTMLMALLPHWVAEGGIDKILSRLSDAKTREKIKEDIEQGIPGWDSIAKEAGWENVLISSLPKLKAFEGKTVLELAEELKKEPAELVFDLLLATEAAGTMVIFQQCASDWENIFQDKYCCIGSDGILVGEKPHPRSYGTFPRVLGKMVREQNLISLEEAIRKITFLPASLFNLKGIGSLRQNNYADLVIFDQKKIGHPGDYHNPSLKPEGIEFVIIAGEIIVKQGKFSRSSPGRILARNKEEN